MSKPANLIGQRFGSLVVIKKARSNNGVFWLCLCDCGNYHEVRTGHLRSGTIKSCGCLLRASIERFRSERFHHGKSDSDIYPIWGYMIKRCYNKNSQDYCNYGGRGISVCKKWRENFAEFLRDMGPRPKGFTLERKDTNGNYNPKNCYWASRTSQNRNSRRSKIWEIHGEKFDSASLAGERFGVCHATIVRWCQEGKPGCFSTMRYA